MLWALKDLLLVTDQLILAVWLWGRSYLSIKGSAGWVAAGGLASPAVAADTQQDGCSGLSPLEWGSGWPLLVQLGSAWLPAAQAAPPRPPPRNSLYCISVWARAVLAWQSRFWKEILNAAQLDSNFKKLHILELKRSGKVAIQKLRK